MRLKSISGLVYYVNDTEKTLEFYETLGFTITKRDPEHVSVRLNWFSVDFHPRSQETFPEFQQVPPDGEPGNGLFVYVAVEDVDEFYQGVLALGLSPSSQPKDYPWGNREFILRDPDGYKLVFFQKKK
jgi:catechol 2,3-dioxygenase-like lactoylglutathione lyase family enzyme